MTQEYNDEDMAEIIGDWVAAEEFDRLVLEKAQKDAFSSVLLQRLANISRNFPYLAEGNREALKLAGEYASSVKLEDLTTASVPDIKQQHCTHDWVKGEPLGNEQEWYCTKCRKRELK